ncbi:hypothetical protein MASR2M44_21490 [Bacteroidota bacterium]
MNQKYPHPYDQNMTGISLLPDFYQEYLTSVPGSEFQTLTARIVKFYPIFNEYELTHEIKKITQLGDFLCVYSRPAVNF